MKFQRELLKAESWKSAWVRTCIKFFLYGTSIEFNPKAGELDRVVNYMIALEAALVPEKDFVSARLKQRALALLNGESDPDRSSAETILNKLYSTRSTIVHGGVVDQTSIQYLSQNRVAIESLVRRLLQLAILKVPADDKARKVALNGLFTVSEDKRAESIRQNFQAINNKDVREKLLQDLKAI